MHPQAFSTRSTIYGMLPPESQGPDRSQQQHARGNRRIQPTMPRRNCCSGAKPGASGFQCIGLS